jgi:hypothetical protein
LLSNKVTLLLNTGEALWIFNARLVILLILTAPSNFPVDDVANNIPSVGNNLVLPLGPKSCVIVTSAKVGFALVSKLIPVKLLLIVTRPENVAFELAH